MKNKLIILSQTFLIVVTAVFTSCTTSLNTPKKEMNLADIYNPSRYSLHPDYSVYNVNDSNTVVYLRIFPAELLFNQANEEGKSLARFSITYKLWQYDENKLKTILSDSARIDKTLDQETVRNTYFSALPLKTKSDFRYILQINIKDELRLTQSRSYLIVDKTDPYNRQNFQLLSTNAYPAFTYIFRKNERFLIKYNKEEYDSIVVDYYNLDRTLPRPIFSTAPEIRMRSFPDSSWMLPYTDTSTFSLERPGIYMFKMEKEAKSGLTVYNFGENFPNLKNANDMLGPLVYLSSSAEFRDLRLKPNRKLAIDNYWLDIAGNKDDARELIRVYYNRVLFSNLYFSSYKEGWKTDRGMVYIIFGAPDLLEKNPDEEIWIYRTKKSSSKIEFRFVRNNSPLSPEDFEMDRNSSSSALWAEAVESWKRGKIYSPLL
ncbi:MAG: GWxTD domain-containing protein [Bacteroidales bacterium]|nr:GWxTD domain-containing protein [Bacteroidales bacterium]MCF8389459.1 GWxTD domain-containing protein [Bacteroidales bacterium]